MRPHTLALLALAVLIGSVRAEDKKKDNAKLIVGKWKMTEAQGAPPNATVTFTKDGKLMLEAKVGDRELKISGTYKVEGDKITTKMTFMDNTKEDTATLKTLTEKKLVIEDANGKTESYERVAEEKKED